MTDHDYRYRKKRNKVHLYLAILISIILFIILLLTLVLIILHNPDQDIPLPLPVPATEEQTEAPPAPAAESLPEEVQTEISTETPAPAYARIGTAGNMILEENAVYTFLQGPRSWKEKIDWSGSWCNEILADQEFGAFGCGLCNLANIYSTLTDCDCSPIDMYYYAKEVSGYTPVSGFGAIDWPYIKQTLSSVGIKTIMKRKDRSYERFQSAIAASMSAIALVCSYNDDTYWHNVEGHYVNLWLYNSGDDTVLLGDSGDPDHNRQRIPLRYVYDALKTGSNLQYMIVTQVDTEGNTWQHNGVRIKWRRPKYYRSASVSYVLPASEMASE